MKNNGITIKMCDRGEGCQHPPPTWDTTHTWNQCSPQHSPSVWISPNKCMHQNNRTPKRKNLTPEHSPSVMTLQNKCLHRTPKRTYLDYMISKRSPIWKLLFVRATIVYEIWILLCLLPTIYANTECSQTYSSHDHKEGIFTSPNYPQLYNHRLRCIYKFIAQPNERVKVNFTDFQIYGVPPKCGHDYIDIYTQIYEENADLLDVPLHGRYCGSNRDKIPHLLISMDSYMILAFYTDATNAEKGFSAKYEFISAAPYNVGDPGVKDLCGREIDGDKLPRGILVSPTYPGMYPDNVWCYYKLQGNPGQRIRFNFLDLDLFSGGTHCPYDSVKIYDGPTNQDGVIGNYCGLKKGFEIFSTKQYLHIVFNTKEGRTESHSEILTNHGQKDLTHQQRGFKAEFEISDRFVDLRFINHSESINHRQRGYHVRGTECDQRILSEGETNGTFTSPGYPRGFPTNVSCHYFLDGHDHKFNLEKTKVIIESLDIDCQNGVLEAFTRGQDITHIDSLKTPDYRFCGTNSNAKEITSSEPRLTLIFKTFGLKSEKGFKARYQFVKDYHIPGYLVEEGVCHFRYNHTRGVKGYFNSPRHPKYYMRNTTCVYELIGNPQDVIRLTFEDFNTEDRYDNCSTDYLEIFELGDHGQKLIEKHCGSFTPGPVHTDSSKVRVVFHSDGKDIESGFKINYEFLPRRILPLKNITVGEGNEGGEFCHPSYPIKYKANQTCDWHIYARPGNRILLYFAKFHLEGSANGCGQAVLNIFNREGGFADRSLCGVTPQKEEILSQGSYIGLRFLSSPTTHSTTGFKIIWTEIRPKTDGKCNGFQCKNDTYCISNALLCDKKPNCGKNDRTDEDDACNPSYTDHGVLHIILGVVITLIFLVFIIVCILHRRRKVRKRKNKKEIEVRYVTRNTINRHMDGEADRTLLKERTEKVSIV